MKRSIFVLLLAAISFFVSGVGCGNHTNTTSQPRTVTVSQSDSGTTVSLHQSQILTVSLQGNGSTGYIWDVLPGSESILAQQGGPQFVPDSDLVGSGGTYMFTFKAIAPGTADLNLIYHRPFETGIAPLQTFEIKAVVES
jgi:inhibitor of cysteine peptidase